MNDDDLGDHIKAMRSMTWEDAIKILSRIHNSSHPGRNWAWGLAMHNVAFAADEIERYEREAATQRRHLTLVRTGGNKR